MKCEENDLEAYKNSDRKPEFSPSEIFYPFTKLKLS